MLLPQNNKTIYFFNPGSIHTRSGGTIFNKHIIANLKEYTSVDLIEIQGDFPMMSDQSLQQLANRLHQIPKNSLCIVDSLLLGNSLPILNLFFSTQKIIPLVHLLLTDESNLSINEKKQYSEEFTILRKAHHIIVTSYFMKNRLNAKSINTPVSVLWPGITPFTQTKGAQSITKNIIFVASMIPRKRVEDLIISLSNCTELNWVCHIAGSTQRNISYVTYIKQLVKNYKLQKRCIFLGDLNPTKLNLLYSSADIFVQTSEFETYGMSLREAYSSGIPCVTTDTGGSLEQLNKNAILTFKPHDTQRLTHLLHRLLQDCDYRQQLSTLAYDSRSSLITWQETAREFYENIL